MYNKLKYSYLQVIIEATVHVNIQKSTKGNLSNNVSN